MTSTMTQAVSDTLLSCPFCGGDARVIGGAPGCAYVKCIKCGASSDDTNGVENWNARALRSATPEPVAWTDQTELDALRKEGHGLINAKKAGPFVIPLYAAPTSTEAGREISEADVEQAFRDGLDYATICKVTDPDEAWRTSRARAALNKRGE